MATYGRKYRAEWKNTRGHEYQLDIYRRDFSGTAKTIKTLCGCALEIQGAQNDVTAPITKTQLRFSVVDAWDATAASDEKWGDWQEFFTPDATLYKVQLRQSSGSNSWTNLWTGYITPDAWHEELGYRNAITVTARDNIGHLKDFTFDMQGDDQGLVQIDDLVNAAMTKIEFPMGFNFMVGGETGYSFPFALHNNSAVFLTDACVNVSLFDGMDWYQVLEQTLEAIGYTMRYVGGNAFTCAPLRNLWNPAGSSGGESAAVTVEFYGGSMELAPAVKEIIEEQDYGTSDSVSIPILGATYNAASQYRCKVDGNTMPGGGTFSIPEHDAPCNLIDDVGKTRWSQSAYLLDPDNYLPDDFLLRNEGDAWKQYAFLPANQVPDYSKPPVLNIYTRTLGINVIFTFSEHGVSIRNSGTMSGKMSDPYYALAQIKYIVMYTAGGTTKYFNGVSWSNSVFHLTKEYDSENEYANTFEINLADDDNFAGGNVFIIFENIIFKMWSSGGTGAYARLAAVDAQLAGITILSDNKVRTVNNTAHNVTINRKPLFGAMSKEVGYITPGNYRKALYFYPGAGAAPLLYPYMVHFTGQSATDDVPLPVAVHEQLLCFSFGAARVLSGRCAPVNKERMRFDRVFQYKGVKYLLQGGTLDLFSGIMEGAVLREYAKFADLWTGTPTWNDGSEYTTGEGSARGGGSSGSGGGGGGGSSYTLPIASASTLGGVKVGTGLSIDGSGVLSSSGGGSITVDSSLSSTSENPVQNKVIYATVGDIETLLAAL